MKELNNTNTFLLFPWGLLFSYGLALCLLPKFKTASETGMINLLVIYVNDNCHL